MITNGCDLGFGFGNPFQRLSAANKYCQLDLLDPSFASSSRVSRVWYTCEAKSFVSPSTCCPLAAFVQCVTKKYKLMLFRQASAFVFFWGTHTKHQT